MIDLVLVSTKSHLLNCTVISLLANSDHNGLEIEFKWKHAEKPIMSMARLVWCYKYADYEKAGEMIDATDWDNLLPVDDVDAATTNWLNKFTVCLHSF